jgi:hypothetical protein
MTLPPIVSPPEDSSLPAKKLLPAGTNIYWDSADATGYQKLRESRIKKTNMEPKPGIAITQRRYS